jgi:hypothetical protein
MKPLGWKYESYRHSLASKGISSGRRAYLAKGNTIRGPLKSFLATPIGKDPVTGQPVYPTQEMVGIPKIKRAPKYDFTDPNVVAAFEAERQRRLAEETQMEQTDVSALPAVYEEPVAPQMAEVELEEAPQTIELPSDLQVQEEEEVSLARKNAFDRAMGVGGEQMPVPMRAPVTPGVPTYTGGLQ